MGTVERLGQSHEKETRLAQEAPWLNPDTTGMQSSVPAKTIGGWQRKRRVV
jgi:hypothetical protein